ncbi:MAG: response regulator [Elusimicrobia bacterium]|nr:response regulator [Elusimicrobiota bacterium]
MALILIVEDELNVNLTLCEILKMEGFETDSAYNGEEALNKIQKRLPDAVILDIRMPVKNGWEVLSALKGGAQTKNIPVIIHSSLNQKEDFDKGFSLGACEYLTKPCDPVRLVAAVRQAINKG